MKDQEAIARFPKLYSLCKHWDCGEGWFPLIIELSEKLEALILENDTSNLFPCASKVKEKFGILRFYMTSETPAMSDLIEEYETKSSKICELCGKTGELMFNPSFYLTRCSECSKEINFLTPLN